jgi:8-oxo-dGTP diphosphatase
MDSNEELVRFIDRASSLCMPSLSIDCVIFGFHSNQLKVLLLRLKYGPNWSLPGGFIYRQEHIDDAANRILMERTGLNKIFLRQFRIFGDPGRSDLNAMSTVLEAEKIRLDGDHWVLQRFLTVGYYALVEFSHVQPRADSISMACEWADLHRVPHLIMDHGAILESALGTLRQQLNYQPIGYNLLPAKFTMPELQSLYETILDKKLDRRNFQRRMLGYGILKRLKETRKGGAHKAPYLYSFNLRRYRKALDLGLQSSW